MKGIKPLPSKTQANSETWNHPKMPKQVCAFLRHVGYYRKFIKELCQNSKTFDIINSSTGTIWVATNPSQCFLNPQGISHSKHQSYSIQIWRNATSVYTDASDDTCGAQLSQEHDGTEFPIAFLSHTFTDTQQKWSTTEQDSLWCILCSYKVELLPSRILKWNSTQRWPHSH